MGGSINGNNAQRLLHIWVKLVEEFIVTAVYIIFPALAEHEEGRLSHAAIYHFIGNRTHERVHAEQRDTTYICSTELDGGASACGMSVDADALQIQQCMERTAGIIVL